MQHAEAIRFMASEKYLLNELTPELREEFEDHFFGCTECALDVRAGAAFVAHSKTALAHPVRIEMPATVPVRQPAAWLAWLRPSIVIPVMALLLAVIGYQNFIGFPQSHTETATLSTPRILPSASLVSVRGDRIPALAIRPNESYLLFIDVPSDSRFTSYLCELYSQAGQLVWSLPVSTEAAKNTLSLQVPSTATNSGAYNLTVKGIAADQSTTQLARYPFELQIQK